MVWTVAVLSQVWEKEQKLLLETAPTAHLLHLLNIFITCTVTYLKQLSKAFLASSYCSNPLYTHSKFIMNYIRHLFLTDYETIVAHIRII